MQAIDFERLIDEHGAEPVVEVLREYITLPRRERIEAVVASRLSGIEVALESPYDPRNASAVVRSAEAFGLRSVHVIAASRRILESAGTTRGTHQWIDTQNWKTVEAFAAGMRERGLLLAGALPSATMTVDRLPLDRPICMVFGNEHDGLAPALREHCELQFGIPIHGFAESFNVSVAAAISLYSWTSRRRAEIGRPGDLSGEELASERARSYLRSVDDRLIRGLFGSGRPEGK